MEWLYHYRAIRSALINFNINIPIIVPQMVFKTGFKLFFNQHKKYSDKFVKV
jgi:hypothetical protein